MVDGDAWDWDGWLCIHLRAAVSFAERLCRAINHTLLRTRLSCGCFLLARVVVLLARVLLLLSLSSSSLFFFLFLFLLLAYYCRCSFSADGTYFASGGLDATVRIWSLGDDVTARRALRVKTICCTGKILSLDWINDSSFLFGTSQNEVRLVNVASIAAVDGGGGGGGGGAGAGGGAGGSAGAGGAGAPYVRGRLGPVVLLVGVGWW
jgi:hypothetical protein